MNTRKLIYIVIPFILNGCAMSFTPKMSSEKQQQLLSEFHASRANSITPKASIKKTAWLQPDNKVESCKVFFGTKVSNKRDTPFWEKEKISIYWDGECKNGYAFGVGREFIEGTKSGLTASLIYYELPGIEPTSHYIAKYDDHEYGYIYISPDKGDEKIIASEIYKIHNNEKPHFWIEKYNTYHDEKRNLLDINHEKLYTGRSYITHSLSDTHAVVVSSSFNPADHVKKSVKLIRDINTGDPEISFLTYINDGFQYFEHENKIAKKIKPPIKLLEFMNDQVETGVSNINKSEYLIQSSKRIMSTYKRRICKGNVSVDFIDSNIYGQICLTDGDLSQYEDQIVKYEEKQSMLWAKTVEHQRKQELIAFQKRQLDAQQAAHNANAINQLISGFNNSMTEFNQNATAFRQSTTNQPVNSANSERSDTVTTKCIRVSNIIRCQSQ